MSNVRRVLIAGFAVIAVLLAGLAFGAWAAVRKPIPDLSGTVSLTGLDGTVTVTRDRYGIPTITADTAEDLFFAQGYVHAQDRFHEMDVRRHVASATFSELVGHRGRAVDQLATALKLPRAAQHEVDGLPASARRVLDAYARGVNAYVVGKSGSSLSLEYTAKTLVGRDYRPDAWTPLDSAGWANLLGWNLTGPIVDEIDRIVAARHMSPRRVGDLYPGYDMADSAAMRTPEAFRSPSSVPKLRRLRESVLAVPKVTGLPIAAGTGAWVESEQPGDPVLSAQVASAIGVPGPWYQVGLRCTRVTSACPYDVSGLSLSGLPGVVVGRNRAVAWGLGPALSADVRLGVVRPGRKAKAPVIARLSDGTKLTLRGDRPAKWSNVAGLLAVDRAADAAAVEDAADGLSLPFALVYADAKGGTGQVPREPEPTRRVGERSPLADLLVPSLMPVEVGTRFAEQGKDTLRTWDRRMSAKSPGAAYFAAVWRNVLAMTFHDELPKAQWPDGSARWAVVIRRLLADPDATWWDNVATPSVREERDDILRRAMEDARDELTMIRARDVNAWDWSDLHAPVLRNPTLDGRLFERGPVPLTGSGETAEGTAWDAAVGYQTVSAPVAKLEMALTRPDESRWVVSTGVSGHAFSDHYVDQVPLWSAERGVRWPFSPTAIKKRAVDRLVLASPTR